jgi:hypothetical protein
MLGIIKYGLGHRAKLSLNRAGTVGSAKTFRNDMPTPKEFRKNADDCLRLSRETVELYAKMALIELATEFRVMAEHLEREETRRKAHRVRQTVGSLLRGRYG